MLSKCHKACKTSGSSMTEQQNRCRSISQGHIQHEDIGNWNRLENITGFYISYHAIVLARQHQNNRCVATIQYVSDLSRKKAIDT